MLLRPNMWNIYWDVTYRQKERLCHKSNSFNHRQNFSDRNCRVFNKWHFIGENYQQQTDRRTVTLLIQIFAI